MSWRSLPFEECIEPVAYTAKVQRKDFLVDGAYPIVSQEEAFINGSWDHEPDVFRVERPVVVFGDHTRALKYIDFDFVLGADGVKVLKPKPFLHPRFFFFQLHTAKLDSLGYARHYRLLKEHQVAFPVYAEQRRIVAILDEAFEAIATAKANAEKSLQSSRDVFAQHLLSVFGATQGVLTPVSKLASCSLGKMLDKAKNRGVMQPYLRNLNVRWFEFELEDVLEMRFSDEEAERYTVRHGDLVICEGGYPGRCAIWEHDAPMHFQKALHRARFAIPVHARWVQYFLFMQDITGRLKQHFTGSGIQHFTGAALARMEVPIPDVAEVCRQVETFDQIRGNVERVESVYRRKLSALDELKKALLHQAFTGQL